MKAALLLALAALVCASGDYVEIFGEGQRGLEYQFEGAAGQQQQLIEFQQPLMEDSTTADPLTDTLYIMDQKSSGSYRVTGMFQNVQADSSEEQAVNQLLERPRISFFDLSWSNWVDERLQFLDMVQDLLVSGSRCPHMPPDSASFDTGMVSYLASSRFGPAILTTYAQKIQEVDDFEFDYDDVNIPESSIGKSYEDASLLEDLSANANEAFQQAELESRSLFQQDGLGFFAANMKPEQDKVLFQNQLDGEFESVQPSLKVPVSYFARWEAFEPEEDELMQQQAGLQVASQSGNDQLANCIVFVMLLIGCLYVWISLARSCCSTFSEARQRKRELRSAAYSLAQKELLVPLNPEKATSAPLIETAALQAPEGTYYMAQGTGFQKVLVPLNKSPV